MNMVIHYIQDIDKLFAEVSRVLKNDGVFVLSTNHFFRPHYPYSEWIQGKIDDKETLFIKVTNYLNHKGIDVLSFWDNKTYMKIYHHPLNKLINGMSKHGLLTFMVEEPEPINSGQAFSEELQNSHHIPTFIIVGAKKLV